MNSPILHPDKNTIIDAHCKNIAVLSDLHKYSGISNFSKGIDPYFDVYYTLYKEHALGDIDIPLADINKKERKTIEDLVNENVPKEVIEEHISMSSMILKRTHDPDGHWQNRQEIFASFKKASHVVLNGDIFDIQCCQNPLKKIEESVQWLKKRMDDAPDTHFHFVLGNHEAFPEFIAAMQALEKDAHYGKKFSFHEHFVRINDALFVHGDEFLEPGKYRLAIKGGGAETQLGSQTALREMPKLFRTAYAGFGGLCHAIENYRDGLLKVVANIYNGIETSDLPGIHEAFLQSNHIFSGHIHEPYAARYKDKILYNTGAMVNFELCPFLPLEIEMRDGKTSKVQALLSKHREKRPYLIIEDPAKPPENPLSYEALMKGQKFLSDQSFSEMMRREFGRE